MRRAWQGLVPGLVVGFGIVGATLAAKWSAVAGPLVLAGAILLADAVAAGERGAPRRPSAGAWILAVASIVACGITWRSVSHGMGESVALCGAMAWVVLLLPHGQAPRCLPPQ